MFMILQLQSNVFSIFIMQINMLLPNTPAGYRYIAVTRLYNTKLIQRTVR